jgi:hypothetical protein
MTSFAKTRNRRRTTARAAALLAIAAAGLAAASPASAAEPWGFEQVTPPNKGGGTVQGLDTFQASPDGNSFLLSVNLPFEGLPFESAPFYMRYLASRGADGWSNRAVDPPYLTSGGAAQLYIQGVIGTDRELNFGVVASVHALTPEATEGGGNVYMRNLRTGELTLMATHSDPILAQNMTGNQGQMSVRFVASDGRSAVFLSSTSLTPDAPVALPHESVLYSWTAEEGLRVASVLPSGEAVVAMSGPGYGIENGARESMATGDGVSRVYFGAKDPGGGHGPVYVRSGSVTKPVSYSRVTGPDTPPVPAVVDAVGADGRFMLFHTRTTDALTADTPAGPFGGWSYLYLYDALDESLEYVGQVEPHFGDLAVHQMTADGQTVAFQSTLVHEGKGVEGRQNIFVWRNGTLRLVATPDDGSMASVTATFMRRLSSNGRFFSYTDNSQSTAAMFGAEGEPSSACLDPYWFTASYCIEVYRFDADANGGEGELACVSCRPDGAPAKGNAGDPNAGASGYIRLNAHQMRTVANDGTVFFGTRNDLLVEDGNGLDDVYAWNDGELRLVSRGSQGKRTRFLDATPDGKTVFLATDDPIAPTDNDRAVDVYMTREGAGFGYTPPVVKPPCVGSDCRGAGPSGSAGPVAGTVAFAGRGNVSATAKPARVSVSKARAVSGGSGVLRVKVPGRGRVRVSGPGVRVLSKAAGKAGTYRVAVRLSKRARQTLSSKRRLSVRVTVRFTPATGGSRSVRVGMTFKAKPSTKKGR